jgi:aminopeptidase YwaD
MKLTYLISVLIIAVGFVFAQSQNNPEITIEELKEHVYYLASEELAGRKPGTEGSKKAADYAQNAFLNDGLKPMGENGFQYFDVMTSIEIGKDNSLSFGDYSAKLSEDYTPLSFSKDTSISAEAVFAGYGFDFEGDSISWHSYDEIDVTGKWAIVLRGSPDEDAHMSPFDMQSGLRQKALKARDKGAAGVIFVNGKEFSEEDELIPISYEQSATDIKMPIVHAKRSTIDNILAELGVTVELLEKQLIETMEPNSFEIPFEIFIQTDVNRIKKRTQNLTFLIEGNDPDLKDEYIVIGAHYDHLGMGGPGSGSRNPDTMAIHYGADDNSSGVASVMELAEKLYANRTSLKRSILVLLFGAEEMGLLGSKYFVENPLVDLNKIKHMVNLDMVGRLNEEEAFTVGGTGTAAGIESILNKHAEEIGLEIKTSPEGFGPSDHASFYSKDIPVLFLFTGIHDDYHTYRDKPEKINYAGMKKIADYVYDIVMDLSDLQESLAFQEAGPKSRPEGRRRFKVTLGIMPDVAGTVSNGLKADAVIKGRPADLAGMKKGDIIVAMEGKPVGDIYEYMNRLSEFKPGQRISVEVMRGEEKVVLIVEL